MDVELGIFYRLRHPIHANPDRIHRLAGVPVLGSPPFSWIQASGFSPLDSNEGVGIMWKTLWNHAVHYP